MLLDKHHMRVFLYLIWLGGSKETSGRDSNFSHDRDSAIPFTMERRSQFNCSFQNRSSRKARELVKLIILTLLNIYIYLSNFINQIIKLF